MMNQNINSRSNHTCQKFYQSLLLSIFLPGIFFACGSSGGADSTSTTSSSSAGGYSTRSAKSCDFDVLGKKTFQLLPKGYTHLKTYEVEGESEKEEHAYIFSKNTNYLIVLADQDSVDQHVVLRLANSEKKQLLTSEQNGKIMVPSPTIAMPPGYIILLLSLKTRIPTALRASWLSNAKGWWGYSSRDWHVPPRNCSPVPTVAQGFASPARKTGGGAVNPKNCCTRQSCSFGYFHKSS
ncbi:MAG: hypothetical protein HC880_05190 [Bacteroidia bacterium]|nr:hypothetical protein [Bacteroidia bacterium]